MPHAMAAQGFPGKLNIAASPPEPRLVELTATRDHLRQVFVARTTVLAAVLVFAGIGVASGRSSLLSAWVIGILALAAALSLFTWLRLQQPEPVFHGEFLLQILADVVLIAAAMHHTGADASPFLILYFVPLTIAAATLPLSHTLAVFVAVLLAHELVCVYLPRRDSPIDRSGDLLELLAAGLVAWFVFSIARTSRMHEDQLTRVREEYLRQRHSNELGTLAATAAHQMSTPLATMAVVIGELRQVQARTEDRKLLELVAAEIESCKSISSRLLSSAGYGRAERGGKVAADKFLAAIVEKCELMQPWLAVRLRHESTRPPPQILAEASLEQAIMVFLQCKPSILHEIEVAQSWDQSAMRIHICGPCADPSQADEARKVDLLLAKTSIAKLGGTLVERPERDGRCSMELSFPLSVLTVSAR